MGDPVTAAMVATELVEETGKLAKARRKLLDYMRVDHVRGCWLVQVGMTRNGYGQMMVDHERDLTHRWSYRAFHGPIPAGLVVRHACDVRNCVNPLHLSIGTQSDNIRECVARGRFAKNRGGAKLGWPEVEAIRASSETNTALAARYGVHRLTIGEIKLGRTWIR
ncbi:MULTISPECIES: HNH endonuclease signature motif containing protein [Streptosporangium]|uniref:HNH nuclease domain-containing protein n=1 Tax=Streptosporangium brasiliense TaxID=47480 RepID=A0ABT9RMC4_9ACTN|nr:HNH endonuclease signature motif containing protein [Streptosporangium brasiliense]MDP9870449.1 hypothetical protein [Streptosporangium brasiliense]